MKRFIVAIAITGVFFCGCCGHKKCVNDGRQAEKSKIEAQKALDEMDKEKNKDAGQ
jgi:hypothetical protein